MSYIVDAFYTFWYNIFSNLCLKLGLSSSSNTYVFLRSFFNFLIISCVVLLVYFVVIRFIFFIFKSDKLKVMCDRIIFISLIAFLFVYFNSIWPFAINRTNTEVSSSDARSYQTQENIDDYSVLDSCVFDNSITGVRD